MVRGGNVPGGVRALAGMLIGQIRPAIDDAPARGVQLVIEGCGVNQRGIHVTILKQLATAP